MASQTRQTCLFQGLFSTRLDKMKPKGYNGTGPAGGLSCVGISDLSDPHSPAPAVAYHGMLPFGCSFHSLSAPIKIIGKPVLVEK